jgi:hypothetical protein
LLFLAEQENRNNEFRYDDLLESLQIPKEYRKTVHNKLWHVERCIDAKPEIRNPLIKINKRGIDLAEHLEEEFHRKNIEQFPINCDKVIRFITKEDKRNINYNAKEISEKLEIDYDTVEAIAETFYERHLIQLSSTDGHYNFHVLPAAHSFVKQNSFVQESTKASGLKIESFFNSPNNSGTIIGEISGNKNTTRNIRNTGDGNIINTGDKAQIHATIIINKGDKDALRNTLTQNGVSEKDVAELIEVIDTEEPNKDKRIFGSRVNIWIKKMVGKAFDGSWQVGFGAAANIFAEAIQAYYGLK